MSWLGSHFYYRRSSRDIQQLGDRLIEKPRDDNPEAEAKAESLKEEAKQGEQTVEEIAACQEPDVAWRMVLHAAERKELVVAQSIAEAALKRHPNYPPLLITAGALWRRQGKGGKAISLTQRAIDAARDREEFEEQFFVANGNLAYQMAREEIGKERALEAGRLAAENAHRFENRDSFRINYGYARMKFADTDDELAEALEYLLSLRQFDLSVAEREEVAGFVREGASRLGQIGFVPE